MASPDVSQTESVARKVGAGMGISGSTAAGIALLFTLITVSQAGCGSVLSNGTYDGFHLVSRLPYYGSFLIFTFLMVIVVSLRTAFSCSQLLTKTRQEISLSTAFLLGCVLYGVFVLFNTKAQKEYYPAAFVLAGGMGIALLGMGVVLWTCVLPVQQEERSFSNTGITSFLLTFIAPVALIFSILAYSWNPPGSDLTFVDIILLLTGVGGMIMSLVRAGQTLNATESDPKGVRFALFARVIVWSQLVLVALIFTTFQHNG